MSRGPFLRVANADAFEIFGRLEGDKRFCLQFSGESLAELGLQPSQARAVLELFASQLDAVLRGAGVGKVYER